MEQSPNGVEAENETQQPRLLGEIVKDVVEEFEGEIFADEQAEAEDRPSYYELQDGDTAEHHIIRGSD